MNIKITKIKNKWHARLLINSKVLDEMACEQKSDIGWICREMMRWADKCSNSNTHTHSARIRHNEDNTPVGKVWYKVQLSEKNPS